MSEICVAYLARARNGIQPLQNFLDSYARNRAGANHDLLIIFKGFAGKQVPVEYGECLRAFAYQSLFICDVGLDLRAYGLAARKLDYPWFCFLNSFSEILAEDWLAKMFAFASKDGVGLVGATGSWESMYSNVLLEQSQSRNESFTERIWTPARLALCRLCFDPFPNYHIRTNAFIVSRKTMDAIWPKQVLTKRGAYLFENGRRSLTKRILSLGLNPLVVGKDGRAYEKEDWRSSNTFRQANQENLLIADNQTRQYSNADPQTQRHLSHLTWGASISNFGRASGP